MRTGALVAEPAKIVLARAAAIAAFASAASFGALVVLTLNVMTERVELAVGYLWGGWIFAVAPAIAILLMLAALWPHTKPGPARILTALPMLAAAGFSVQHGSILAEAGAQINAGGGVDGAFAMGAAFVPVFVWLVILGMAVAALVASFGIARPLGPIPLVLALFVVVSGAMVLVAPGLALLTVAGMAGWWAVVGAALWGLSAPLGEGAP